MFKVLIMNKDEAIRNYDSVENILCDVFYEGKKRCKLYTCNAEIWECNGFIALVSYNTPIALYTPYNETLYDCLRVVYGYTATSSKHICKFKKWLDENNYPVQNAVRFIK